MGRITVILMLRVPQPNEISQSDFGTPMHAHVNVALPLVSLFLLKVNDTFSRLCAHLSTNTSHNLKKRGFSESGYLH